MRGVVRGVSERGSERGSERVSERCASAYRAEQNENKWCKIYKCEPISKNIIIEGVVSQSDIIVSQIVSQSEFFSFV